MVTKKYFCCGTQNELADCKFDLECHPPWLSDKENFSF